MESSIKIFDAHQEAIFFFSVVLSLVCSIRDSHLMERRTVTSHLRKKEQQVRLWEYNLQRGYLSGKDKIPQRSMPWPLL